MRPIAVAGFSGRDHLELVELPAPEAGPDDVLVRVRGHQGRYIEAWCNVVDWAEVERRYEAGHR